MRNQLCVSFPLLHHSDYKHTHIHIHSYYFYLQINEIKIAVLWSNVLTSLDVLVSLENLYAR